LQAAVHAVHGAAESFEQTDWDQIVAIYDHLLELAPTAVIALNRAIAVSETTAGPAVALALVDALADELATYHFLHATRGELLVRLGEPIGASLAFGRAAELAPSDADRSHLAARLATIGRPARPT
jgi:RNA polymerase sigma-70 factor (ECF subfamily)